MRKEGKDSDSNESELSDDKFDIEEAIRNSSEELQALNHEFKS